MDASAHLTEAAKRIVKVITKQFISFFLLRFEEQIIIFKFKIIEVVFV